MGRRKAAEPLIRKKIVLRKSTVDAIDHYLLDPLTDKAAYGEWSKLVEALLRKHLKEVSNVNLTDLIEESEDGNASEVGD